MLTIMLTLLTIDIVQALAWHLVDRRFARVLLYCALGGGAAFLLAGLWSGLLWLEPPLVLGVFPAAAVAAALAALLGVPFLLARSRGAGAAGNAR